MDSNLKKTAVITGASSGIGKSAALELAKQGYEVLICSRNSRNLEEVKRQISDNGGVAHTQSCDVSQSAEVTSLVSKAQGIWDHLDVLFNNAGSGEALALEKTTDEAWQQMIGSSLNGTFYCCREFLPLIAAAPAGLIINNTSIAARRGFPNFSAYSAAKGGVASFSNSIREELRAHNVRVTTLYLGATDSPFWDNLAGEWNRSAMMSCQTIGEVIATLAALPSEAQMEELQIMPSGGAL